MHVHGVEEQNGKRVKEANVDSNVEKITCERCGFEGLPKGDTCPNCGWDSPLADRLIVEVDSNVGEAPEREPKPAKAVGADAPADPHDHGAEHVVTDEGPALKEKPNIVVPRKHGKQGA